MRTNMPVTNNEYVLTDSDLIVSKTDTQGKITYINEDFKRISGYAEAELIGQPHNLVRHPDMPAEAFADLWNTLKAGKPWTGYVKNRCKNGDFYWVLANATPIKEGGSVVGYMSVRTKPSRAMVEAHAAAYQLFKEGKQGNLRVQEGKAVKSSVLDRFGWLLNASIKARLQFMLALGAGLPIVAGALSFYSIDEGLRNLIAAAVLLGIVMFSWVGLGLIRSMLNTIQLASSHVNDIAQGRYTNKIEVEHDDEVGKLLYATKSLQIRMGFEISDAKRAADETTRIKIGLDNVSTGVMIADNNRNIIYMNSSVQAMMTAAESDIRKDLPNFNASKLVGTNIDGFHKNPAHQKNMLATFTSQFKTQIVVGGRTFALVANPVINDKGERLGAVVEWNDITEQLAAREKEVALANENTRIRIALDNVGTNVMIADNDRNIIYMNKSIVPMMTNAESAIRKDLPNFNVSKLIGTNIDSFHKNPAHQKNLLATFTTTFRTEIIVGGRTFSLVANPVMSDTGERLGSVVEWNDRTAEVATEKEVASIVEGAVLGDFSRRMDMAGKTGFFKQLGEGMNKLTETSEVGLNEVVRMLSALSKGDLTDKITNEYFGTFGQLKDDANATVDNLKEIIGQVKEATDTINTAAKEIAAGNADLSQRTEEQASSLEETAASMEELTSTVKQNAENAKQANQLAKGASEIAMKGGAVVSQVVGTMSSINDSSKKIVDIISVIDGIAFQTNILALNAAVEAARAGEQGRGFAVVASEVRSLAQRSAAAAKEIKTLIGDSVDKVEVGTKLVDEAGKTMEEIVNAVKRVTDIMSEISAASNEQSTGIEQVNQAITQMDEVTQQNAALVEEAAAAAESMEEQAQLLAEAVSTFKLDQSSAGQQVKRLAAPAAHPHKAVEKPALARKPAGKPKALPSKASKKEGSEWEEF